MCLPEALARTNVNFRGGLGARPAEGSNGSRSKQDPHPHPAFMQTRARPLGQCYGSNTESKMTLWSMEVLKTYLRPILKYRASQSGRLRSQGRRML